MKFIFHFQIDYALKVFEIIIKVLYQCLQTLCSMRLLLLGRDVSNFQDFDALGKTQCSLPPSWPSHLPEQLIQYVALITIDLDCCHGMA